MNGRATFCISERRIRLPRSRNSICTSELGFPRPLRITSSDSATRFAFGYRADNLQQLPGADGPSHSSKSLPASRTLRCFHPAGAERVRWQRW